MIVNTKSNNLDTKKGVLIIFKSIEEFNGEVARVLDAIQQYPKQVDRWQGHLSEESFYDLLEHTLKNRLASGFGLNKRPDDFLVVSLSEPHVTQAGLKFLKQKIK
ncbi:hypothetical protein [Halobacillus hunanensis]|uniref:hypothetical protein n=1 Tax=Halobacillus hunanensis TaxID=578214 RepID=UPI0009A84EE9|nr:hypothetical protein [Halobacillus hunanensis]